MHRLNTNFHSAGIMQPNHINDLNEVHCRIKVWQCSIIQSQQQSMCNFQILRHRERPHTHHHINSCMYLACASVVIHARLSVSRWIDRVSASHTMKVSCRLTGWSTVWCLMAHSTLTGYTMYIVLKRWRWWHECRSKTDVQQNVQQQETHYKLYLKYVHKTNSQQ